MTVIYITFYIGLKNIIYKYIEIYMPWVTQLKNEVDFMREKVIEQRLVKAVKGLGGISPKFVSPGLSGMPDRIVLLPDGKVGFVEVKAPGKKPRALQVVRHEKLRALGFKVFVLDGEEQIGEVLDEIGGDAQ